MKASASIRSAVPPRRRTSAAASIRTAAAAIRVERRRPGGWPGGVPPPFESGTLSRQPARTPAFRHCVIRTVWPAISTVPLRDGPACGVTDKVTVPFPAPEGVSTEIQSELLLRAYHAHASAIDTVN